MSIITLKNGAVYEGTIDKETSDEIWVDETTALGDIVVLLKADILSIESPKKLYTMSQWNKDRVFKAEPGQAISKKVYDQMLYCLPSKNLPNEAGLYALRIFGIPVHSGFLMGEPETADKNGILYRAFGMNNFGKPKYFYLGLSTEGEMLNGDYYYFDCLEDLGNDNLYPVKRFRSEKEAIITAMRYEATLYKRTYDQGTVTNETKLHDSFNVFEETEG